MLSSKSKIESNKLTVLNKLKDLCTGCQPVMPTPGALPLPLPTVGMTTTLPSVSTMDYKFPARKSSFQLVIFICIILYIHCVKGSIVNPVFKDNSRDVQKVVKK